MSEQRFIDADKYKESLFSGYMAATVEDDNRAIAAYEDALGCLDSAPTIDPETLPIVRELRAQLAECKPVVHAHWIRYDDTDGWNCSSCDYDICGYDDNPAEYGVNFCERCGAKMDEATE